MLLTNKNSEILGNQNQASQRMNLLHTHFDMHTQQGVTQMNTQPLQSNTTKHTLQEKFKHAY